MKNQEVILLNGMQRSYRVQLFYERSVNLVLCNRQYMHILLIKICVSPLAFAAFQMNYFPGVQTLIAIIYVQYYKSVFSYSSVLSSLEIAVISSQCSCTRDVTITGLMIYHDKIPEG